MEEINQYGRDHTKMTQAIEKLIDGRYTWTFIKSPRSFFCICWIGEQRLFRHTISEWTYVSVSHQFLWRNRNWVDSNGKQEIEFYLNYICIDRYDTTFSTMISIVGRKKAFQWQTKLDGYSM